MFDREVDRTGDEAHLARLFVQTFRRRRVAVAGYRDPRPQRDLRELPRAVRLSPYGAVGGMDPADESGDVLR